MTLDGGPYAKATKAWLSLFAMCLISNGIVRGQSADPTVGARLFHLHCAECHGPDGQGGQGPDLTRGQYRHGSTDDAIYKTISRGVPGTPMPATSLAERQL